jgi:hypothetical protein
MSVCLTSFFWRITFRAGRWTYGVLFRKRTLKNGVPNRMRRRDDPFSGPRTSDRARSLASPQVGPAAPPACTFKSHKSPATSENPRSRPWDTAWWSREKGSVCAAHTRRFSETAETTKHYPNAQNWLISQSLKIEFRVNSGSHS